MNETKRIIYRVFNNFFFEYRFMQCKENIILYSFLRFFFLEYCWFIWSSFLREGIVECLTIFCSNIILRNTNKIFMALRLLLRVSSRELLVYVFLEKRMRQNIVEYLTIFCSNFTWCKENIILYGFFRFFFLEYYWFYLVFWENLYCFLQCKGKDIRDFVVSFTLFFSSIIDIWFEFFGEASETKRIIHRVRILFYTMF